MAQVTLGDVAIESRETYKGDKSGMPIVGLEHLIPEDVVLSLWDRDKENTFTKMFRKGDMLFGRRRAYLKKAAQAPFDGICSGDITVIRAKEDRLIPELLPFIIQNDVLFDFAVGKSAGSLSPRVKWENLKNYKFELPPLSEQKKLAEALWAINDTLQAYQKLLIETDELVKSQFVEMFGDYHTNSKGFETHPGIELFKFSSGKFLPEEKRLSDGIPVYGGNGIAWYTDIPLIDYPTIIIGRVGALCGNIHTVHEPVWITDNAIYIKEQKTNKFTLEFLTEMMTIMDFYQYADFSGQPKITQKPLESLHYLTPPIEMQNEFTSFCKQVDKSKFALQNAISAARETKRSIIADALGIKGKE